MSPRCILLLSQTMCQSTCHISLSESIFQWKHNLTVCVIFTSAIRDEGKLLICFIRGSTVITHTVSRQCHTPNFTLATRMAARQHAPNARVPMNAIERNLIVQAYQLYGTNWMRVDHHVIQNLDPASDIPQVVP